MRARPFLPLLLAAGLLLAPPAAAAPVVGKPAPAFTLPSKNAAITLVVYEEMDAPVAKEVAAIYGLDPAATVVLPDPQRSVTLPLYQAEPCPRIFVVDSKGVLRYTNDHADDAPRKAPALVITSRTLQALRAATPVSPKAKPAPRPKRPPIGSSAKRSPAR
jgi:hypothetical protein